MTPTQRLREALTVAVRQNEHDMLMTGEELRAARAALAEADAEQEPAGAILPDGSAFMVASFPLPADHWLYAPRTEWDNERDDFAETPIPILSNSQRRAVAAAARYAIRGATMCGKEMDFDPDAMVQNFCYAMCGSAKATTVAAAPAPAPLVALTEEEITAVVLPLGFAQLRAQSVADVIQRALAAKNGMTIAKEGQKP